MLYRAQSCPPMRRAQSEERGKYAVHPDASPPPPLAVERTAVKQQSFQDSVDSHSSPFSGVPSTFLLSPTSRTSSAPIIPPPPPSGVERPPAPQFEYSTFSTGHERVVLVIGILLIALCAALTVILYPPVLSLGSFIPGCAFLASVPSLLFLVPFCCIIAIGFALVGYLSLKDDAPLIRIQRHEEQGRREERPALGQPSQDSLARSSQDSLARSSQDSLP